MLAGEGFNFTGQEIPLALAGGFNYPTLKGWGLQLDTLMNRQTTTKPNVGLLKLKLARGCGKASSQLVRLETTSEMGETIPPMPLALSLEHGIGGR